MKKITLLHIAQVLVFFLLLWIQKSNGYTWSIMLGQPSLYFYFIFPASLASGVFGLTFAIFTREMNWFERIASILITAVLSIIIGTSPWIYIQAGSSLQTLIYVMAPMLVVLEILWALLVKELIKKNNPVNH